MSEKIFADADIEKIYLQFVANEEHLSDYARGVSAFCRGLPRNTAVQVYEFLEDSYEGYNRRFQSFLQGFDAMTIQHFLDNLELKNEEIELYSQERNKPEFLRVVSEALVEAGRLQEFLANLYTNAINLEEENQ